MRALIKTSRSAVENIHIQNFTNNHLSFPCQVNKPAEGELQQKDITEPLIHF